MGRTFTTEVEDSPFTIADVVKTGNALDARERELALARAGILTKQERLAYIIACALVAGVCHKAWMGTRWSAVWGASCGQFWFDLAVLAWTALSLTHLLSRKRVELGILVVQIALVAIFVPPAGVSLPLSLLMLAFIFVRALIRLALWDALALAAFLVLGCSSPAFSESGLNPDFESTLINCRFTANALPR